MSPFMTPRTDDDSPAVGEAQHARTSSAGAVPPHGRSPVEKGKRVAHRAFGGAGNHRERFGLGGDIFFGGDAVKMPDERLCLDAAQIEAVPARAHRQRHLVDLRRREHELDVLGGSSSVFRSALNAAFESMCTSSRM